MRFQTTPLLLASASAIGLAHAQAEDDSTTLGYTCTPYCIPSTIPSNETSTFSFGENYAVLNLDLISGILQPILNTTAGEAFINSTATWIDAVHALDSPPLSIFTRIFYSNSFQPEIGPNSPFALVGGTLGNSSDPNTEIYEAFNVNETAGDVVIAKTRYYAGAGNPLESILRAQQIDTVVLSGIRTSGVILNTAYQLFDLDYKVYVIANNTIETPPFGNSVNTAILEGIIPKLPADVITLEEALGALNRSGPTSWGSS